MSFPKNKGRSEIHGSPLHVRTRKTLLATWKPGDPCCLCGQPMWGPTSQIHADHLPGTTQYRGLAHAHCNRRDGARRGAQRKNAGIRKRPKPERDW